MMMMTTAMTTTLTTTPMMMMTVRWWRGSSTMLSLEAHKPATRAISSEPKNVNCTARVCLMWFPVDFGGAHLGQVGAFETRPKTRLFFVLHCMNNFAWAANKSQLQLSGSILLWWKKNQQQNRKVIVRDLLTGCNNGERSTLKQWTTLYIQISSIFLSQRLARETWARFYLPLNSTLISTKRSHKWWCFYWDNCRRNKNLYMAPIWPIRLRRIASDIFIYYDAITIIIIARH